MTSSSYQYFQPAHSDFLVHWTGKDIDSRCKEKPLSTCADCRPNAADEFASVTCEEITQLYLGRLKDILRFGLWMTEPDDTELSIIGKGYDLGKRPRIPRTCFTELKLSEARSHAVRYGRLGIGFKRPFVMNRGGLPVWYYPTEWGQWAKSVFGPRLRFGDNDLCSCFMKEMGTGSEDRYKYLHESEWRIIFSEWLNDKEYPLALAPSEVPGWNMPSGATRKPVYLLPVDRWLSLIIYPSIQALCVAQQDQELRQLLRSIKREGTPVPNAPKYTAPWEEFTLPVEIELDSCRNF
jgi:hypothetical protein